MKPLKWDSTDPATGQPYRYDSVNLTWDGILEPGDPGYTDTAPNPTTLKKWKHRDTFQADDTPVGVWSQTVEIVVGG